jgi:hypothetical protein
MGDGGQLPTGTVTFLFTDIEGSTRLAHELGAEYEGCASNLPITGRLTVTPFELHFCSTLSAKRLARSKFLALKVRRADATDRPLRGLHTLLGVLNISAPS